MKFHDRELMFIKGNLVGVCDKCEQPTTGSFESDDDVTDEGTFWVKMECVNCYNKEELSIDPNIIGSRFEP